MATFLYWLGRFSYRHRVLVVVVWFAALVLGGFGAARLSGPTSSTFSIPGTQSQQAMDLLAKRMPAANADDASAQIVFIAKGGAKTTGSAQAAAIRKAVTTIRTLPGVASAVDPLVAKAVSPDGSTALANVSYSAKAADISSAQRAQLSAAARTASSAGLQVEMSGTATQAPAGQSGTEGIGLIVAALVLVITFGSFLAAGLPLLAAILGVVIGVLGISIASGFTDISATTPVLALMLGLAVAIDYAMFIIFRYRHHLIDGTAPEEAVGRALGTAGSAVVFAGSTVVIALAALAVVGIPFLTTMGLAAAGTVAVSVVIALTLLPALLGFLGTRVLGRRGRVTRNADSGAAARGEHWSRFVLRHRWVLALGVVAGLVVVAAPAFHLNLGMPSDATASPDTTQRRAYDAVAEAFGPGFNGTLLVAADLSAVTHPEAAASTIARDVRGVADVTYVSSPTLNKAHDLAIITVVPGSGPSDAATGQLVHDVRAGAAAWQQQTGARVYVTGQTAVNIDISDKLSSAMLPYLVLVVGLAFVLLTLVFRSLLVPLKATLGFLLSVAATFGAVVAVFQWGWLNGLLGVTATGPVLSFLPIFLIGVLFGLAMDYEVFLVTRMREEHVHGATADESVALGFRHGARVVTAAAIIMTSVFAGFLTAGDQVVKSMGFALAVGVLVDAFLVRMTLVPAVMSLLGARAWSLPRWLDRVLPDVDVEGASLQHRASEPEPSTAPELQMVGR